LKPRGAIRENVLEFQPQRGAIMFAFSIFLLMATQGTEANIQVIPPLATARELALVVDEYGATGSFLIQLTSQPTSSVTIAVSSGDTSQGNLNGVTALVFTTVDWGLRALTVTGVDDGVTDGDTPFLVVTADAKSDDGTYHGLESANVAVKNSFRKTSPRGRN
jgi:hypothetical protein